MALEEAPASTLRKIIQNIDNKYNTHRRTNKELINYIREKFHNTPKIYFTKNKIPTDVLKHTREFVGGNKIYYLKKKKHLVD